MEINFTKARWNLDAEGLWLSLKVEVPAMAKKFVSEMKDKLYIATIKEFTKKRSPDANKLFWKACQLIAQKLETDNDSIYLQLLSRYGVSTYIVVKKQAVEQFKKSYRWCEELGEVTINGQTGIQLKCVFGSSTYDTKQMSRLIDGTLSELKEMGIDFVPESDIAKAKKEWAN